MAATSSAHNHVNDSKDVITDANEGKQSWYGPHKFENGSSEKFRTFGTLITDQRNTVARIITPLLRHDSTVSVREAEKLSHSIFLSQRHSLCAAVLKSENVCRLSLQHTATRCVPLKVAT